MTANDLAASAANIFRLYRDTIQQQSGLELLALHCDCGGLQENIEDASNLFSFLS